MNDTTIDNPQERLEFDLCWLGGIIDGEGCITISSFWKRYNGNSNFTASPIIQITNTNYELVTEVSRIYKLTGIRFHIAEFQPKLKNTKIRYDISIKGLERCREAIDILGSYIRIKRNQLFTMSCFIERRLSMTRNSPITGLDIQYVTRIRELNSKGSSILNDYTPKSVEYADKI